MYKIETLYQVEINLLFIIYFTWICTLFAPLTRLNLKILKRSIYGPTIMNRFWMKQTNPWCFSIGRAKHGSLLLKGKLVLTTSHTHPLNEGHVKIKRVQGNALCFSFFLYKRCWQWLLVVSSSKDTKNSNDQLAARKKEIMLPKPGIPLISKPRQTFQRS